MQSLEVSSTVIRHQPPWSRRVSLAMSHHLPVQKLAKLVGDESWKLYEEDLKQALQSMHELGLGGYTSEPALAQPADIGKVGEKRQRQLFFEDDDSRDATPSNPNPQVFSAVDLELFTWRALKEQELQPHVGEDGIMNHYSLFTKLKDRFPLLFSVFRQVAPGIAHEANVERVNSAAERLSDPNMKAETLRRYVFIARNSDIYGLDLKAVRQKYILKHGALSLAPPANVSIVSPCMYACKYVFMYACMYVCMHVQMIACMSHVCMYECVYACVLVHACSK